MGDFFKLLEYFSLFPFPKSVAYQILQRFPTNGPWSAGGQAGATPGYCDRKARVESAQSFTLWQQATIEIMRRNHSIIACSRHTHTVYIYIYMGVVLRAHPVRVNRTFNAAPTERLQQGQQRYSGSSGDLYWQDATVRGLRHRNVFALILAGTIVGLWRNLRNNEGKFSRELVRCCELTSQSNDNASWCSVYQAHWC